MMHPPFQLQKGYYWIGWPQGQACPAHLHHLMPQHHHPMFGSEAQSQNLGSFRCKTLPSYFLQQKSPQCLQGAAWLLRNHGTTELLYHMKRTLRVARWTVCGMQWRWTHSAFIEIPCCLACCTTPSTRVSLFEALSSINAMTCERNSFSIVACLHSVQTHPVFNPIVGQCFPDHLSHVCTRVFAF